MGIYCSPECNCKKSCFSTDALLYMIKTWNLLNISNIKTQNTNTCRLLYNKLDEKMKKYCGTHKYYLWCGILDLLCTKKNIEGLYSIKYNLKKIEKKYLKPEKPSSWYKNKKTWLSNYDIQNVMVQYKNCKKYKYDFLGVFSIDFYEKSPTGQCLYNSFCKINIEKYIKQNKKFIGFITNLDRHNQSGSHWTSTFIVIDPKLNSYGLYYYDSVANSIPSYLKSVFLDIQNQCNSIYPDKKFNIYQNHKQHQYKNSECGMFSMLFQIRWINKYILKKNLISFAEIIANPYINDDKMLEIRDHLYRPNTIIELKQLKLPV